MIIKEINVTIMIKDMDKSISFYESIGFTVKNRWGNDYAQLTASGVTIGLHPTSDENLVDNSGNLSIGFITEKFEEAKSLLHTFAIPTTERTEDGGQFLHFTDPDGTALYFYKS